jgi:hypothetical protein
MTEVGPYVCQSQRIPDLFSLVPRGTETLGLP